MKKKKIIYNKFKYNLEKLIILDIKTIKNFNNINKFFFKFNININNKKYIILKFNYFKFIIKKFFLCK